MRNTVITGLSIVTGGYFIFLIYRKFHRREVLPLAKPWLDKHSIRVGREEKQPD